VNPDPIHQKTLEQAEQQPEEELRRRLAVKNYRDPDFLPSEVLSSFIKLRFGKTSRLLDVIISTLTARVVILVGRFFKKSPGVLRGGEEAKKDAAATVMAAIVADQKPLGCGFAEIRFAPFVECRLLDFVEKERGEEKETEVFSDVSPGKVDGDEEGAEVPFEQTVAGSAADQPENEAYRKEMKERLARAFATMTKLEKLAVYLRLEHKYKWEKTARLMKCSVPTARKYYDQGIARLNGEMDDEQNG
jgi:hypothetical protein